MTPLESRARELLAKKVAKSVAMELLGMSHIKFDRLLKQWKITWPNQNQALRITHNGITATFAEHSLRMGINAATLKSRWRRSGSLDLVYNHITLWDVGRFVVQRKHGIPAWFAAEKLGHSYEALHKKATDLLGTRYKTIVRQAPRKRRTRAELQKNP